MVFYMNIDHLQKMSQSELIQKILKMEEEKKALEAKAITDTLTGLHNRASFDDHMEVQIDLAKRLGHPLSVIVIDLDKFKSVNDNYGHTVGDMVLKMTSKTLDSKSRKSDIACRFGGEELVLILPETNRTNAALVAEKIRIEFEKIEYPSPDGKKFKVTGSFGVASFSSGDTAQSLFDKADKAVYQAKKEGRNQIKITENSELRKQKITIKTDIFDDSEVDDFANSLSKNKTSSKRYSSKARPH